MPVRCRSTIGRYRSDADVGSAVAADRFPRSGAFRAPSGPAVETLKRDSPDNPGMAREFQLDRRAYLRTVGMAGASAAVAGCLGGSDEDVIVPGTASGFPPFEFREEGDLVGFDIDLAEAVIDEAGYEAGEWVDMEFDSLIPALNDEEIDLIAAAMTIDPERAVAFSEPYYEADQGILVADNGFDPQELEDLEDRRVGAQAGTTGEELVETQLIDAGIIAEDDYRAYDNYTLAVEDLESGNIDAVVVDTPVADTFADDRAVRVAFVVETNESFGFGMRDEDERLEDINDGLAAVKEDSRYDDLVSQWFE